MAIRAGGGNCNSASCMFCYSQRILRHIGEITDRRNFDKGGFQSLIYQWERLFAEPAALPYCYRNQGTYGFIHLVGKSYVSCHQLDMLESDPYTERQLYTYQLEVLLERVLSKYSTSADFTLSLVSFINFDFQLAVAISMAQS